MSARRFLLPALLTLALTAPAQNLRRLEYFFDTDPGFGQATSVPITAAPSLTDFTFNAAGLASLSPGIHVLGVRARDANGRWSTTALRPVLKMNVTASLPAVRRLEYFIDTDPGFGQATSVAFTPAPTVADLPVAVSLSGLSAGIHTLYLRAQDALGKWSLTNVRSFLLQNVGTTLPDIRRVEYFFDTDPGFGQAVSVPFPAGPTVSDLAIAADLSSLSPGIHVFYARAKDARGKWSLTNVRPVLKQHATPLPPNLTRLEYFFDTDPGFGQGTAVPITPGPALSDLAITADLTPLTPGVHVFYVRSRDALGKWSLTNVRSLLKEYVEPQPTNLVAAEFFLDTDPGFGNGIPLAITPPAPVLTNVTLTGTLPTVPVGSYTLYIRARDELGKWSLTNIILFQVVVGLHEAPTPETALRLFPNPSTDGIYRVEWPAGLPPAELLVLDATGRTVARPALAPSAATLDLSALPAGTYHLRVIPRTGPARTFSLLRP